MRARSCVCVCERESAIGESTAAAYNVAMMVVDGGPAWEAV